MYMNEHSLLRRRVVRSVVGVALLVLAGCGGRSSVDLQGIGQKNAGNFSETVFVGDSLTAGFQSGSLLDTSQTNGWAALVAKQANFAITLPLIAFPGAPNVLQLKSLNPLVIAPAPGQTTGRENFAAQPTDLAVPGHTLNDALNTVPLLVPKTGEDQLTQLVLGFPQLGFGAARSQVDEAISLHPTTIFIWIGNNDALVADFTGMPSTMTSTTTFATEYQTLTTKLASTGANLVFLNIPDVTAIPFLQPAATVLALTSKQSGIPVPVLSHILGIQPGDFVNPTGTAEIPVILNAIAHGQAAGPIDDAGVLSASEVVTAQANVAAYNQTIAADAASVGGTVVDINALLKGLGTSGITIDGFPATTNFLGGLFSLDGIHPTNTGYALIANDVIDTLNAKIHTSISDVNVGMVALVDPLFPPNLKPMPNAIVPASVQKAVSVLFKK
jgi:lysophospholipase L1-like esterase